jgi:uncharacterized repeat protein (TIGR01451 family)
MSHIENAVKTRPKGLWLLAALIAAFAIGMALWGGGSGGNNTAQADVDETEWSLINFIPPSAFPPDWWAGEEATATIQGTSIEPPDGDPINASLTAANGTPVQASGELVVGLVVNPVFEFTGWQDTGAGDWSCDGLGTNILLCSSSSTGGGSSPQIQVAARLLPFDPNDPGSLGCWDGRHIELQGNAGVTGQFPDEEAIMRFFVADGTPELEEISTVPTGPGFDCRSLIISHTLIDGVLQEGELAINKPSSHHLIRTVGAFITHDSAGDPEFVDFDLLCGFLNNPPLDGCEGSSEVDYGYYAYWGDPDIIQQNNVSDLFGLRNGYLCHPDGTPVTGAEISEAFEEGELEGAAILSDFELCLLLHGDDGDAIDVAIIREDNTQNAQGGGSWQMPNYIQPFLDNTDWGDPEWESSNILRKMWLEEPLDILHVQRFTTADLFQLDDGGFECEIREENDGPSTVDEITQVTTANDEDCIGNDMLEEDDDGDGIRDCDYEMGLDQAAFKYCDEILIDDNWNVIGSAHLVRTDGWQPGFVIDEWLLEPQFGSTVVILAGPGDCPTVASDSDLDFPDGTSLWDSFSPAYQAELEGEQCIAWTSTSPGETFVSLQFHDEGAFSDGSGVDEPDDSVVNTVGPIIKEWNEITETHLIRVPSNIDEWDEDDDNDDVENIDDIDWQHENDIQGTVISQDITRTVSILEKVHGEHQTGAPGVVVDEEGKKISPDGLVHAAVDHAIVFVEIDDNRNCTTVESSNVSNMFNEGLGDVNTYGHESGRVVITDRSGNMVVEEHGGVLLTFRSTCTTQARIIVHVEYPRPVASAQPDFEEIITINWTVVEEAKQPIIKKAGEEHVLEVRWSDFVDRGDCDVAGHLVIYTELSGPGALLGGWENIPTVDNFSSDDPDFVPTSSSGGQAVAEVNEDCISAALYSSEDPGEGDVEAVLCNEFYDDFDLGGGFDDLDCDRFDEVDEPGLISKHAFLMWYVKLYSITLTDVPGALTDVLGPNDDPELVPDDLFGSGFDEDGDSFVEAHEARWSPQPKVFENESGALPATDVRSETRNVLSPALVRVQVKDYLYLANNSSRPDVCLDMDGDGNGSADAVPGPYRTVAHEGCPDAADELLAAGYWVLPDDMATLAGVQPASMRSSWDVLFGPTDAEKGPGAGLIGPKREVDTHDGDLNEWVFYPTTVDDDEDLEDVTVAYRVIDGRIDVNGDGVIDGADDGFVCGVRIINGEKDMEDDGDVDLDDDGIFECEQVLDEDEDPAGIDGSSDSVINGRDDINDDGEVDEDDDGWVIDSTLVIYKSLFPNHAVDGPPGVTDAVINIWDAIMPLEKITLRIDSPSTSAGSLLAIDKDAVYTDGSNPYYRVFIPAHWLIPAFVSNGGYDWDSTQQGPYEFWDFLQKVESSAGRITQMQVYTDNHGEAMALVNGFSNLPFTGCTRDPISGAPDCPPGAELGRTRLSAIADYPYFRKHRDMLSAPDEKIWISALAKTVTVEPVVINQSTGEIDPFHAYIVAHLVGFGGTCDVTIRGEEVDFLVAGDAIIEDVQLRELTIGTPPTEVTVTGGIDIGGQSATGVAGAADDFDDILPVHPDGELPFPADISEDECQAYALVKFAKTTNVINVIFHEPEGDIIRSIPFPVVDLSVTKTGPATVNAGANATYTVTVTNDGEFVAHDVIVTDSPSHGQVVSMTPAGGLIGTLQPGQSATVQVVVAIPSNVTDGTQFVNTATADAAQQDEDLSDNAGTATSTVSAQIVKTLFPGWNFVEWEPELCAEAVDAFAQLTNPDTFNVAWTWAAQVQMFDRSYDDDAPPALNTLQKICPGDILAIHVAQKVEWVQVGTEQP